MSKIVKQSTCMLLIVLFVFSALSPTYATGTEHDIETVPNDSIITEETATFIATFFVQDYEVSHETMWTNETGVSKVVTLYDVDKVPIAYSIELETDGIDTGYVVVSAYSDVENIILEFADEGQPLYYEFDNWDNDNVVYTGLLGYFLETEDGTFEDLDGVKLVQEDIKDNLIINMRSPKHLKHFEEMNGIVNNSAITDPFSHARRVYGGSWDSFVWRNDYDYYVEYIRQNIMQPPVNNNYARNCVPTAVTNLIVMIGNRYNINEIKSLTNKTIYNRVAAYAYQYGYRPPTNNSKGSGTTSSKIPDLIKVSFSYYGITQRNMSSQTPTYNNIVLQLNRGVPFYLRAINHPFYSANGRHGVAAFAFTRLRRRSDGAFKSYVKIADGWAGHGRYIDIATINTVGTGQMISWSKEGDEL